MSTTETVVHSDVPSRLMELLYLRSVWSLPRTDNLPQLVSPPQAPTTLRAPAAATEWSSTWQDTLEQLSAGLADGLIPSWRQRFGLEGIDDAHLRSWHYANDVAVREDHMAEATNRRCLRALLAGREEALARGFSEEYVLPGVHDFHVWLSREVLLIASPMRFSARTYEHVLAEQPH